MEPLIVIVGFLGAGKTTLLKKLVRSYLDKNWNPYIILNDYENATLDAQQLTEFIGKDQIAALSGSCICCTGLPELRTKVNAIPRRPQPITFIEANGTTDACALLGFLGVGLDSHFLPPIQIALVDAKSWQLRGYNNELEASQVQLSSMIILNHTHGVKPQRIAEVKEDLKQYNPYASILAWEDLDISSIINLEPSKNTPMKIDHAHAHWSSCSVDLPDPMSSKQLQDILDALPKSILRVKACTRLDNDRHYSYVEKIPSGEAFVRVYTGDLVSGPKLLTIGPGSDPDLLRKLVAQE